MTKQPEFVETRTITAGAIASERDKLEENGYRLISDDEEKMIFVLPPSGRPGAVILTKESITGTKEAQ
jgi:hypothetical protein